METTLGPLQHVITLFGYIFLAAESPLLHMLLPSSPLVRVFSPPFGLVGGVGC
jgi:hypothetical protein